MRALCETVVNFCIYFILRLVLRECGIGFDHCLFSVGVEFETNIVQRTLVITTVFVTKDFDVKSNAVDMDPSKA